MHRLVAALSCAALLVFVLPACERPPNRVIAAGDIAGCGFTADSATADVVQGLAGTVLTLGDNVYNSGTSTEFTNCYQPTWGRHDGRVRPSPGNHDYVTADASGYFGYFGDKAGPSGSGYYYFDVGSWRVFSLNSEANIVAAAAFVRANAGGKECIAAYWHKPMVSSGLHGNNAAVEPLWQAVYDVGGDLVLNGHDHDYERFAELDRTGAPSPGGMREFVVGTGGAPAYPTGTPKPGSEVRSSGVNGVISVDLNTNSYSWTFRPVAGQNFTDSGTGTCG